MPNSNLSWCIFLHSVAVSECMFLTQDRQRVVDNNARQNDMVKLDVGVSGFHVWRTLLTSQPDCLLQYLFSGRFMIETQPNGSVFLDR